MTQKTGRFDILSSSESGLSYVREKRGGLMRVLTESELEDFNDPPPCPECAEQFGCEHINCAGEPLLSETELESAVPAEWMTFAKENGVSLGDLERLRIIERGEEGFRIATGANADMRAQEIVLLLNDRD
jgi:hypothetical protein